MTGDAGRRPIEPGEQPWLYRLGGLVREMRIAAGHTQAGLATAVGMSARSLRRIESGARRTRPSTLSRLASAIVPSDDEEVLRADLIALFVAAAGPGLASESAYAHQIDARRRRRTTRRASQIVIEHITTYERVHAGTVEYHRHRVRVSRRAFRESEYWRLRDDLGVRRRIRDPKSEPAEARSDLAPRGSW